MGLQFFSSPIDQIEKIGLRPFLDSAYAKEWPTLIGLDWVETEGFSAADLSVRYARVTTESLFKVAVGRSKKNNTIYSIKVTCTRFVIGMLETCFSKPVNGSIPVRVYFLSLNFWYSDIYPLTVADDTKLIIYVAFSCMTLIKTMLLTSLLFLFAFSFVSDSKEVF